MKIGKSFLTVFIYLFVVLAAYSLPSGSVDLNQTIFGFIRFDSLLHMILFLPWMYIARIQRQSVNRAAKNKTSGIVPWMIGGVFLGAGIEMLHILLPYRVFNPMDAAFNITGVLLGALIFKRKK